MDNKQDKGFTLVELLIVIVILGILATVTVFAVRGITERSQENACDVELRALDTAVEASRVVDATWAGASPVNEAIRSARSRSISSVMRCSERSVAAFASERASSTCSCAIWA